DFLAVGHDGFLFSTIGVWTRRSVSGPLDALQIDSLFVHLVEGGHVAKVLPLPDDEVGHVVDLVLRVEPPEPESDARVRQLVSDSERAQDVARLEAGGGAGRAARDGDV